MTHRALLHYASTSLGTHAASVTSPPVGSHNGLRFPQRLTDIQRATDKGQFKKVGAVSERLAVLLDFDGTLTQRDLGEQLLNAFADPKWREEAAEWRDGRVSFKVMNEREFAYLPADKRREMEEYASGHARLRDGALELVRYCEEKGILVEIVSGGLDFYIRAVLTKYGLAHLPVLCLKQADFTQGNGVVTGYPDGVVVCETTGACKC